MIFTFEVSAWGLVWTGREGVKLAFVTGRVANFVFWVCRGGGLAWRLLDLLVGGRSGLWTVLGTERASAGDGLVWGLTRHSCVNAHLWTASSFSEGRGEVLGNGTESFRLFGIFDRSPF